MGLIFMTQKITSFYPTLELQSLTMSIDNGRLLIGPFFHFIIIFQNSFFSIFYCTYLLNFL